VHRRALLSAGLAVATAGCFGFGSGCSRSATLDLSAVSDADVADAESDPPDSLSPPERDAFAAARRGESPTMWSVADPFADTTYVAVDGTYYAVDASAVDRAERPGYRIELETGPDVDTTGRVAGFDDLPAVDRTALFAVLGYPSAAEMARFERARSISIGGVLAYPDDEAASRSELVPDPAYDAVRIADADFRLRLVSTEPTTMEARRIETRPVADSADAFAALAYERDGVVLDERDLSPEQRDIVETAIAEGYDECAPYSDAFVDLQGELGGVGGAGEPFDYATYRDEWYVVDLYEAVA
jgi:hypothetical protein